MIALERRVHPEAAILSTILSVGSEAGISANNNGSLAVAIQQGLSQSINQAGERVVSRSLNTCQVMCILVSSLDSGFGTRQPPISSPMWRRRRSGLRGVGDLGATPGYPPTFRQPLPFRFHLVPAPALEAETALSGRL